MKVISGLTQGSDAWLAHRRTTRNASDAPAMMGASPYVTRSQLIRERATGIAREIDEATQRRFDEGHRVEPLLRELAESIIGETLYPITATTDDGYMGASYDGVTMDDETLFEGKLYNAKKIESISQCEIPPSDFWQLCQQFAVNASARRCLYLCGDGTPENTLSLWVEREQVEYQINALLDGWAQFDADVEAYQPEPERPAAVATPIEGFGSLSLRVEGRVLACNLDSFKAGAEAFIARLPKPADLQTDQDFADAKAAVKACAEAEARIDAALDASLAEMADVDHAMRTARGIKEIIRASRLALDKVVAVEEKARKESLVADGVEAVRKHYADINKTLGEHAIGVPADIQQTIGGAIKGLKSLDSMRDKIGSAVANAKIAGSQRADLIRQNVAVLAEFEKHAALLPDRVSLCASKTPEDLRNLIAARVAEYERKEAARLESERAKIRAEEEAKAQAAAAAAERGRIAAEAAAKREAEVQREPEPEQKPEQSRPSAVAVAQADTGARKTETGARIKLADINAAIAPLQISAAGLAEVGFDAVGTERAAKLYRACDLPRICRTLAERLNAAAVEVREAA